MPPTRTSPLPDPEHRPTTDTPEGAAPGDRRRVLAIAPFRWFWLGQSISAIASTP